MIGGREAPASPEPRTRPRWLSSLSWVFGAKLLGAAAAFLTNILAGRVIDERLFGQYLILISVANVASGLFGPALDAGLVRTAANRAASGGGADGFFRAAFRLKVGLAVAQIGAGVALGGLLGGLLLHPEARRELPGYAVALAVFAGSACLPLAFFQSYFQARERFAPFAVFDVGLGGGRLAAYAAIAAAGVAGVASLLWAYALTPLALALAAAWRAPRAIWAGGLRVEGGMDAAGALVRFSKWILAATAFTALSQRAGVFLLGYFEVAPEEQSRFGAAFTIALAADLLVISFFTTLLPRASAATDPAARRTFVRAMTGPSALLAAAVLAGIPLSGIAVAVAYAGRYPGAGGLLAILLAGAAPMLLSTPFSTAMFSAGRPQWIAALEGLKLAMTVAAGAWAAPRFGALGAAWAVTGAKAATACLTAAVSIYVLARDG